MKRGDIIVTCDICEEAQYNISHLTEDGDRWLYGDEFDWLCVNGIDICPNCRCIVATAFRLGIADELQWADDLDQSREARNGGAKINSHISTDDGPTYVTMGPHWSGEHHLGALPEAPLLQWECPVHGLIDGVLTFSASCPGPADKRHYCALCIRDTLRASDINGAQLAWGNEDE